MEWMLMPLKRYADFSGRSRRKEYWMFALFNLIVAILFVLVTSLSRGGTFGVLLSAAALLVFGAYCIGTIVPSLAVCVRRFHDQDRSGWFVLLGLIPILGGLIVFIFMVLDGTPGPNRWGPDPKERNPLQVLPVPAGT